MIIKVFPEFYEKILKGTKKLEFRKVSIFKNIIINWDSITFINTKTLERVNLQIEKIEILKVKDIFKIDISIEEKIFLKDYYKNESKGVVIHLGKIN